MGSTSEPTTLLLALSTRGLRMEMERNRRKATCAAISGSEGGDDGGGGGGGGQRVPAKYKDAGVLLLSKGLKLVCAACPGYSC